MTVADEMFDEMIERQMDMTTLRAEARDRCKQPTEDQRSCDWRDDEDCAFESYVCRTCGAKVAL